MADAPHGDHEIVLCFDTTVLAEQLAKLSPEALDEVVDDSARLSFELFVAEWTPAISANGTGKFVLGIRLAPNFQQPVGRATLRAAILDDVGHDDRS
ncbi:MAG: hypothetical protein ACHQRJ_07635 [Alphaproteobacteria bacterium]